MGTKKATKEETAKAEEVQGVIYTPNSPKVLDAEAITEIKNETQNEELGRDVSDAGSAGQSTADVNVGQGGNSGNSQPSDGGADAAGDKPTQTAE